MADGSGYGTNAVAVSLSRSFCQRAAIILRTREEDSGKHEHKEDDIASVAYWYQTEPHGKFPQFPDRDKLEIM